MEPNDLTALRREAADCRMCSLYRNATQTVFGEGPADARVVLLGEQPGDREDLQGHPFVGPAGALLDRALADAGIDRRLVYITNTVKHFKFERKGKRRIHKKPNAEEIRACRPWLDGELRAIGPEAVVALGATAAQGLLGRGFLVSKMRGVPLEDTPIAPIVAATVHPSSILRARDDDERRDAYESFVDDLRTIAAAIERRGNVRLAG